MDPFCAPETTNWGRAEEFRWGTRFRPSQASPFLASREWARACRFGRGRRFASEQERERGSCGGERALGSDGPHRLDLLGVSAHLPAHARTHTRFGRRPAAGEAAARTQREKDLSLSLSLSHTLAGSLSLSLSLICPLLFVHYLTSLSLSSSEVEAIHRLPTHRPLFDHYLTII